MQQLQPTPPREDNDALDHALMSTPTPTQRHKDEALDWTAHLPDSDHVRFFRNTAWTRTGLGPLQDWSPTLRLFTGFVLADSRPACLWWGPTLIAIYVGRCCVNDA
jgi:hypothetical protein